MKLALEFDYRLLQPLETLENASRFDRGKQEQSKLQTFGQVDRARWHDKKRRDVRIKIKKGHASRHPKIDVPTRVFVT